MQSDEMIQSRNELNSVMNESDAFFKNFGMLDDEAYRDGAIPKKNKELMGLAISVVTRCNECILYHLGGCVNAGADKNEILEAIKIGVIGGGSITYPNARFAFKMMKELKIID
jgi:AhpD family alkylhydroperoxidase